MSLEGIVLLVRCAQQVLHSCSNLRKLVSKQRLPFSPDTGIRGPRRFIRMSRIRAVPIHKICRRCAYTRLRLPLIRYTGNIVVLITIDSVELPGQHNFSQRLSKTTPTAGTLAAPGSHYLLSDNFPVTSLCEVTVGVRATVSQADCTFLPVTRVKG